MELVLMRHGIAVELNKLQTRPRRDQDRPLTGSGRRKASKAAKGLRELGLKPDLVVHSGLLRAKQTAKVIAKRLKPKRRELVATDALEPYADPHRIFEFLARRRASTVVVVGHAPNLDRVAAIASGVRGRQLTELGKAGAIAFELPRSGRPPGRLLWLLEPSMLRRLGG